MMKQKVIFALLLILGYFGAHSMKTRIDKRISVGSKNFKCKFQLKHTTTDVNLKRSKFSCTPKKLKLRKPVDIELESEDGFSFSGTIKINPNKILEMNVHFATTEPPQTTTPLPLPISGSEEVDFKEIYTNVSSEIKDEYKHSCGIDTIEEEEISNRGFTLMEKDKFWANAEVPWSFVSNGDEMAKHAVHTDANVGLTKDDVKTVMAAMKQIEDKTCIKFNKVKPVKDQPWLFVSRDARANDKACQRAYVKSTYVGKDVAGLGDIYKRFGWVTTGACFGGAYAWYGSDSPQNFGISKTTLTDDNQGDIGLVVHELLHNLGIGHTQKRQDASEHVEIKWNNINKGSHSQYQACVEANDWRCSRYNHYDVEYDCSSIMHYRDYFFITSEARAAGGKTMIAKKANCDLGGYRSTLSETDIAMLNKMYCKNKPQKNVITSPNYPSNYPDNLDKDFPITVDKGVIELSFTHFKLEPDTICADDWVMVVDADGTTLLDKTCGENKPSKITSRTKSITIKFHSDGNKNYAGFRAEYKQVESAPKPVNGAWSKWSGYSTCSNKKDGKSACIKKKVRFCNNPPASNGGAECEGNSEETKACSPTEMSPNKNPNCVLTGGWSVWSQYSTCSSSCRATRTRTCNNPAPINSKGCDGDASESSTCSGGECPSKGSGTIQSTNYPSKYPNNDDVTFPLEVEAGSRIQLKFTDFDLESHANCRFDYVKVVDSDGTTELANLCGAQIPSDIKSSGNKLTVVFHSDVSVNSDGFQARWTKIPGKSSGVITSPNYPNTYKTNDNKIYNLYAPEGSKIELTINELNIEWKDKKNGEITCPWDKLTVYDGPIAPSNKKAELCGSSVDKIPTKSVVSTGNTMTVVFTSDGSVVFKGFKASWKQV